MNVSDNQQASTGESTSATPNKMWACVDNLCKLKEFADYCGVSDRSVRYWKNKGIPKERYSTIKEAAWNAFCKKAEHDYRTQEGKRTTLSIATLDEEREAVEDTTTAKKLGVPPLRVTVGGTNRELDDPLSIRAIREPYLDYLEIRDFASFYPWIQLCKQQQTQPEKRRPDPVANAVWHALDRDGKLELLEIAQIILRRHTDTSYEHGRATASLLDKYIQSGGLPDATVLSEDEWKCLEVHF